MKAVPGKRGANRRRRDHNAPRGARQGSRWVWRSSLTESIPSWPSSGSTSSARSNPRRWTNSAGAGSRRVRPWSAALASRRAMPPSGPHLPAAEVRAQDRVVDPHLAKLNSLAAGAGKSARSTTSRRAWPASRPAWPPTSGSPGARGTFGDRALSSPEQMAIGWIREDGRHYTGGPRSVGRSAG